MFLEFCFAFSPHVSFFFLVLIYLDLSFGVRRRLHFSRFLAFYYVEGSVNDAVYS